MERKMKECAWYKIEKPNSTQMTPTLIAKRRLCDAIFGVQQVSKHGLEYKSFKNADHGISREGVLMLVRETGTRVCVNATDNCLTSVPPRQTAPTAFGLKGAGAYLGRG